MEIGVRKRGESGSERTPGDGQNLMTLAGFLESKRGMARQ